MKNKLGKLGVVVFATIKDNTVKIRGRWGWEWQGEIKGLEVAPTK